MPHDKSGLIAMLEEIAALMELSGENPFHSRAYEQAARILDGVEGQPDQWLRKGTLERTKGIGKSLAEKVKEFVETGRIEKLDELRRRFPPTLVEMLRIPGLGPKKLKALYEKLKIKSIDELETAARSGALAELPGFGAKTAEKILAGIEQRRQYGARHTLDEAAVAAELIFERLRPLQRAGVIGRLELAGSLRRSRETIKDLDFVATSADPGQVMRVFLDTPQVESVVAHGETKSSILLRGGIPVDLRVVPPESFAAALNYFTGSKAHNTALRGRAKKLGFKLNEYGLYPERESREGAPLPLADEAALYRQLGLAYIEPELRENTGEIEAAETGALPDLISADQLIGVLHCHTTYSDGHHSVEEMAAACQALGYGYLAICDHSQSAAYAGGLKTDDVLRQWDEIDALNARLKGFHVFKGIESDILGDGALDYPDALLEKFDLVVISIHSRMNLEREAMTRRIVRAIEHPAATILGHPSGRLLLRREPYEIDMDAIIAAAAHHGVVLEINAHPLRLDLDWRFLRQAKAAGCRFAINPDAHVLDELKVLRFGVGVARKGWLTVADVINTLPLGAFSQWLAQRRKTH